MQPSFGPSDQYECMYMYTRNEDSNIMNRFKKGELRTVLLCSVMMCCLLQEVAAAPVCGQLSGIQSGQQHQHRQQRL